MQELKLTWEERIESIKAGGIAAGTIALLHFGFSLLLLTNEFLIDQFAAFPIHHAISGAIALFSGFLFGVTYRYIIRQDQSSHLKSGAVLAFGLVRGSAQIDLGMTAQTLIPAGILAIESVLLFAIARLVLDGAMHLGWVRRFKG